MAKRKTKKHELTPGQAAALADYADWAGPDWKRQLRADWMRAGSQWPGEWGYLQQLRNTPGFDLTGFKLKSMGKAGNPKAGKLIWEGRYLTGRKDGAGNMILTATPEGREEAQDWVAEGKTHPGLYEMFEDWIGNGWTWVPPEAIGALTDGEIISQDASIDDHGDNRFLDG